jgi:RNA polymerase sigma factor (sigma-70 family)
MPDSREDIDAERLASAVLRLRPDEREVLLFSARERLSNPQIADRLGISTEAVERLLARALTRLDRDLAGQERPWWRFW